MCIFVYLTFILQVSIHTIDAHQHIYACSVNRSTSLQHEIILKVDGGDGSNVNSEKKNDNNNNNEDGVNDDDDDDDDCNTNNSKLSDPNTSLDYTMSVVFILLYQVCCCCWWWDCFNCTSKSIYLFIYSLSIIFVFIYSCIHTHTHLLEVDSLLYI